MAEVIYFPRKTSLAVTIVQGLHDKPVQSLITRMKEYLGANVPHLKTTEIIGPLPEDCPSCEMSDKITAEIVKLSKDPSVHEVILECDNRLDPFTVIHEVFIANLAHKYHLKNVVTVIDLEKFWSDYESIESLRERNSDKNIPEDYVDVIDILTAHIEFCDFMIMNGKSVSMTELSEMLKIIRVIQPQAKVYHLDDSVDAVRAICAPNESSNALTNSRTHAAFEKGSVDQFSMLYKRDKPFHPDRFHALMQRWPVGIVRTYGEVWLASNPTTAFLFSQTGPMSVNFVEDGDFHSDQHQTQLCFVGFDLGSEWEKELDTCLMREGETIQSAKTLGHLRLIETSPTIH